MSAPIHPDNAAQAEFWSALAQGWIDRQEIQDEMLRPVDERLLAAAAPRMGERVIDVGCGCGATAIEFARRVGLEGEVLGLDISSAMLKRAKELAPADLRLRFALADATIYDFVPRSADLVVSRFGVMFFANPALAFANLRKGLRRGGRLAFVCFRAAKLNPWVIVPLREALKHAPPLPETDPEAPGPFAFADAGRVRNILGAAGYDEIVFASCDVDIDLALGRGLDTAVQSALMIGPTNRALAGQSEAVRAAAAVDIRAALAAHARGDSVPLGGAFWIVTAINQQE